MSAPHIHLRNTGRRYDMKNWQKSYPPYEGTEPYLYFAFAEEDSAKLWPLVRLLLSRGCRIWYSVGNADSAEELLHRQERAGGAALTLLYLTAAAREDRDTKSAVLVNQSLDKPILILDTDRGDSGLSMGLREDLRHISATPDRNLRDLESEIIRAEGFTQEMIGEPCRIEEKTAAGKLAVGFAVLAVVLLVLSYLGTSVFSFSGPGKKDSVSISDPVLLSAARSAVDGALTEESLAAVTELQLKALPDSWEDLDAFPALEKLILPQSAAAQAEDLPDGEFTVVLTGGGK